MADRDSVRLEYILLKRDTVDGVGQDRMFMVPVRLERGQIGCAAEDIAPFKAKRVFLCIPLHEAHETVPLHARAHDISAATPCFMEANGARSGKGPSCHLMRAIPESGMGLPALDFRWLSVHEFCVDINGSQLALLIDHVQACDLTQSIVRLKY